MSHFSHLGFDLLNFQTDGSILQLKCGMMMGLASALQREAPTCYAPWQWSLQQFVSLHLPSVFVGVKGKISHTLFISGAWPNCLTWRKPFQTSLGRPTNKHEQQRFRKIEGYRGKCLYVMPYEATTLLDVTILNLLGGLPDAAATSQGNSDISKKM